MLLRLRAPRSAVVALAALGAGLAAVVLVGESPSHAYTSPKPLAAQAILDRVVADPDLAPGAVGIVLTPHGIWRGAAGYADLAARRPMRPDDYFRIGSTTKTYVATIVLQLVGEGKLGLGDTVQRWLPEVLPSDKRSITVRDLLTHTSGLFDPMNDGLNALHEDEQAFLGTIRNPGLRARVAVFWSRFSRNPSIRVSPRLWIELAAAEPLFFPPGSRQRYSNTGFVLLGDIVERVTGSGLASALAERIAKPLGLSHTRFVTGPTLPAPSARLYTLPGGANSNYYRSDEPVDTTRVSFGSAGAGSVVATAEDVARFYAALLGGVLLPPALLNVMLDEGMGIGSGPTACGAVYRHNGGGFGYVSAPRARSDGRRVTVLLVNARGRHELLVDKAADDLFCAPSRAAPGAAVRGTLGG